MLILTGGSIVLSASFSLISTSEIQAIWKGFEASRSVKSRSLGALRSQLGYGGMIHNFKNFILRREQKYFHSAAQSLGGARAELIRYQTFHLSPRERRAIADIGNILDAYGRALTTVAGLVRQGKTPAEIDRVVRIDDGPAIRGLQMLEEVESEEDVNRGIKDNKACIVSTLRSVIGYGGMIHNYKNYLLRREASLRTAVGEDISRARRALSKYEALGVNGIEKDAIKRIRDVLTAYENQTRNIAHFLQQGETPMAIDRMVYVEDAPALAALNDLDREIVAQSESGAVRLREALERVMMMETFSLFIAAIATLVLIAGCYWLIRVQIVRPINSLTENMTRLAREDLDIEIQGVDKNNEIGSMAKSLRVFKENVRLLQKTKKALHDNNIYLEQRIAERTRDLERSEARLSSILDTAADAIICIDETGIIQDFNAAATRLFGFSRDEALGHDVSMLVPGRCREYFGNGLLEYLVDKDAVASGGSRELVGLRKNGETFPIELSVSRISHQGRVLITGIARDITEKKQAEQRLRQSNIAANKANQAKSEFLASMSHELRTPLNAILGFAQVLKKNEKAPLNSSQEEAVDQILKGGDHLLRLVDHILDFNKIEEGVLSVACESVELESILDECLQQIAPDAKEKGISLTNSVSGRQVPRLYADQARLKQVIAHLLSNAIKYNNQGGEVILDGQPVPGGMFRLTITDSGAGIPEDLFDAVFRPFERLGRESGRIEGAGVGLAISKRLMELMGGRIGFENRVGGGSRFWIDIPVDKAGAIPLPGRKSGPESNRKLDRASGTILCIEDNPANMRLMEVIIGQLHGVRLLTAADAAKGIELARRQRPDLILMDINLPDLRGTEALRILREGDSTAHIPVIAVSADAMPGDIQAALGAGFAAYLTKPLDVAATMRMIEEALRGSVHGKEESA